MPIKYGLVAGAARLPTGHAPVNEDQIVVDDDIVGDRPCLALADLVLDRVLVIGRVFCVDRAALRHRRQRRRCHTRHRQQHDLDANTGPTSRFGPVMYLPLLGMFAIGLSRTGPISRKLWRIMGLSCKSRLAACLLEEDGDIFTLSAF